ERMSSTAGSGTVGEATPGPDPGARLSESELCPDELLAEQEAAFARDIGGLHAREGEFVPTNCPACDAAGGRAAFHKYGFAFLQCNACQTIYMSPPPPQAVRAG